MLHWLSAGFSPDIDYMPLPRAAAELAFENVHAFLVLFKGLYVVGFTLLSRFTRSTICVDEVPAPRSRPTTVREGNGGL